MKKINEIRRVVALVFVMLTFMLISQSFAFIVAFRSGQTGTANQANSGVIDSFSGTWEAGNCSVEVMWVGSNGQYDPPGTGDDVMRAVGKIVAIPYTLGKFSVANVSVNTGEVFYVRVWNASTETLATKYGTSELTTAAWWPTGTPPITWGYDFGSGFSDWADLNSVSGSNLPAFYVNQGLAASAPTISLVTPETVKLNDVVTIDGTNFSTGGQLTISNVVLTEISSEVLSWNSTRIRARVNANMAAGTGVLVRVTVSGLSGSSTVNIDPTVTSGTINNAIVGVTSVSIEGSGFGSGTVTIRFPSSTDASATGSYNGTILSGAVVPAGLTGTGGGNVNVIVNGRTSNAFSINMAIPSITSLSPSYGRNPDPIVINGTNLGTVGATYRDTAYNKVTINGVSVGADITGWQNNAINFNIPTSIMITGGAYPVVVRMGSQDSNAVNLNVSPEITSIPSPYSIGRDIVISGTAFGGVRNSSYVKIKDKNYSYNVSPATWSSTSITVKTTDGLPITLEAGALTAEVWVVNGGNFVSNSYTFTGKPSAESVAPTHDVVGNSAVISGYGFGATKGSSTVKFGSNVASTTGWSNTSITAVIPSGSDSQPIVVTVNGVDSSSLAFNIDGAPAPTISAVTSPIKLNDIVTIDGTNFGGAPSGGDNVTINNLSFSWDPAIDPFMLYWSANKIQIRVPSSLDAGNATTVHVNVGGQQDASGRTTTIRPAITSGNITGAITGVTSTNFTGGGFGSSTVTVKYANGVNVSATGSSNGSAVNGVIVPAGTNGTVTGAVTIDVNSESSDPVTITMATPTISSLSPSYGKAGSSIVINATNVGTVGASFRNTSVNQATLNSVGLDTNITNWQTNAITFTVPASISTAGAYSVAVTAAGQSAGTLSLSVSPEITPAPATDYYIGSSMNLLGTAFGSLRGSSYVKMVNNSNTYNVAPGTWSNASLTAQLSDGMPGTFEPGNIDMQVVVVNGGDFVSNIVTVTGHPNVVNLRPSLGLVGTLVTVEGYGFGSSAGTITFGGTSGTPISWSSKTIEVLAPAGGSVVVTKNGQASNSDKIFNLGSTMPSNVTNLFISLEASSGNITLTWESTAGLSCEVLTSSSYSGPFTVVTTVEAAPFTYTDPNPGTKYYKVKLVGGGYGPTTAGIYTYTFNRSSGSTNVYTFSMPFDPTQNAFNAPNTNLGTSTGVRASIAAQNPGKTVEYFGKWDSTTQTSTAELNGGIGAAIPIVVGGAYQISISPATSATWKIVGTR